MMLVPIAQSKRTQPIGMEVSAYTIKRLREDAILEAFRELESRGLLTLRLQYEEVNGVSEVSVIVSESVGVWQHQAQTVA